MCDGEQQGILFKAGCMRTHIAVKNSGDEQAGYIIHTESTSKLNDLCPVLVILWSALPVSPHHHSVGR